MAHPSPLGASTSTLPPPRDFRLGQFVRVYLLAVVYRVSMLEGTFASAECLSVLLRQSAFPFCFSGRVPFLLPSGRVPGKRGHCKMKSFTVSARLCNNVTYVLSDNALLCRTEVSKLETKKRRH